MDNEGQNDKTRYNYIDIQEHLLVKGDELQKLSVIASLPELLKHDKNGTVSRIMPKIQQELPNSSSEFNLASSKMFDILLHMDIPVNLTPQILMGIENKDPIIANAWMETLLSVIPILKENIVKHDILKCAISKSQLSRAAYFRVSSCKILGKLSVHRNMSSFEVKRDILPLVQSLCQDCFHEVRAAMCKELPSIAQGLYSLGDTIVKVNLLPLLVELSSDENVYVRAVSIDSVVLIVSYLSSETIKTTIIPLLKKLCTRSVSEGDTTFTALANNYSKLLSNLQSHLIPNDAMWFLDYYVHICKRGLLLDDDLDADPSVNMLCRENCARSLPMVAAVVLAEIPSDINVKWYSAFKDLAADPCYIVRKALASCYAETLEILGTHSKLLVPDFIKLLRDEDEEVLQIIVPKIGCILEIFVSSGVISRDLQMQALLDIGRAMLKCFNQVFKTNNWRMKESILKQFETLPSVMPSDFIHQHFTQLVINATLTGRAKPVRSQATKTLLIILRFNLKENQRKWIRECIYNQLCNSNCCYTRQIYVQLCSHALNIFSRRYFKEYFYAPLLSLADDSVPVVRLSAIKLCPILKQMLILPADRSLQIKLESILSKLEMIESDTDVIRTLTTKLKEMRTMQGNKNDVIIEEKRRIEEEEKVFKGKIPIKLCMLSAKDTFPENKDNGNVASPITVPKPGGPKYMKKPSQSTQSDMSFLDQHFYIDAGVSFPKNLHFESSIWDDNNLPTTFKIQNLVKTTENLTMNRNSRSKNVNANALECESLKLMENDIISVENINSLTEKDLKTLQTTNITDDVKANLQKISQCELKKRSKRYSFTFSNDLKENSVKKNDNLLKRRSLNITRMSDSKIPVSSKPARSLSHYEKLKSVSDQNINFTSKMVQKTSALPKLTKSSLNLRKYDENESLSTENNNPIEQQQMPEILLSPSIKNKESNQSSNQNESINKECIYFGDNLENDFEGALKNTPSETEEINVTGSPEYNNNRGNRRKISGLPVFIARKPGK